MIAFLRDSLKSPFFIAFLLTISLGFSSCKEKEETALNLEGKSMEQLIAENAELEALSLEKDRLMSELMQTSTFINEIYSAMEEVKTADGEEKERIIRKIRGLSDSLTASQAIIKSSSAKIRTMQTNADEFSKKIAELEKSVSAMQEQLLTKDNEIAQLKTDASIIMQSRDEYKEQASSISNEKDRIEAEKSTFYYIIGKASELEDKGIIVEEGSGFLGIGGTYVPGRNLNEQDFMRIDARNIRMLPIPEKYQIVSSHNPKLLERVSGGMSIIDPARFWNSKFLIIIDKR